MKRILSILLATLMVMTMLPALAASTENEVIQLYDSYDDGCIHSFGENGLCADCGAIDPEATEVTVTTATSMLEALQAGINTKLGADITLILRDTGDVELDQDVTLDLNGHTLSISNYSTLFFGTYDTAIDFILKNGNVVVDDSSGLIAQYGSNVWLQNITTNFFETADSATVYLDKDTTVSHLSFYNGGIAYTGEGTVERMSFCYAGSVDVDPTVYVPKDHTVSYNEETEMWTVNNSEYRPTLTGETVTVYFNNWIPDNETYYYGYLEDRKTEDDSRPAEQIHLRFLFAVDGNGDLLYHNLTTEDGGKTWKLELDKAYTNCWAQFHDPAQGRSTFLFILPTEDEMIYNINNNVWLPYEEFLNPTEGTLGDLDGDGDLTAADATLLLQYLVGKVTEIDTDLADFSEDGAITIYDAVLLLQFVSL